MKVPVKLFSDVHEDKSLNDVIKELESEKTKKIFTQEKEEIPPDFDQEKIKELDPDPEPEPEEIETFSKDDPPAKKEKPFMPYDEQAEMLVTAFDSIQQISLPYLAKKQNFTAEERKKVKIVIKKRRSGTALEPEEKLLFEKWIMIKDFEDELPFSEKETKFLINPLAKILEHSHSKLSPGYALIAAAATVTLPRVAMMISLKSDLSDLSGSIEIHEPKLIDLNKHE
jgi:hypothetical protein